MGFRLRAGTGSAGTTGARHQAVGCSQDNVPCPEIERHVPNTREPFDSLRSLRPGCGAPRLSAQDTGLRSGPEKGAVDSSYLADFDGDENDQGEHILRQQSHREPDAIEERITGSALGNLDAEAPV